MQQQIRRKKLLTLMQIYNLSPEDILFTIKEIRVKLWHIFKSHIGEEDAISPYDLFEKIFEVSPDKVDVYKREFWWTNLKKIMKEMRKNEEIFFIFNKTKIYVLEKQEEAEKFKTKLNQDIIALNNLKDKADNWVRNKKWKRI